jgi:hypothetical protein
MMRISTNAAILFLDSAVRVEQEVCMASIRREIVFDASPDES